MCVKDEVAMKIGKVTDLLNTLTKHQDRKSATGAINSEIRTTQLPQNEAAKVAVDFGTGAAQRTERIAELRESYKKGDLKYDSQEVAKAVFRDLLV